MNGNALNANVRAEARLAILVCLYAARFDEVSDQVLSRELREEGHDGGQRWVHKDVHYLAGKGLLTYRTAPAGPVLSRLTADGLHYVEGFAGDVTGVAAVPADRPTSIHQLREKRWHVLLALYNGQLGSSTEQTILLAINDAGSELTDAGLRRELRYLEAVGLVDVTEARSRWLVSLTPTGCDVVEFSTPDADVPAGVDRIEKYW